MTELSGLCIHQICFGDASFADTVAAATRAGVSSIGVWREKLEAIGASEAKRILDGHGVSAFSIVPGEPMTHRDDEAFATALDRNRALLETAAAIGAKSIVVTGGGVPPGERDLRFARDRFLDGVSRLVPEARAAGVTLAIETVHPMLCASRGVLSTLAQAGAWCDELDADDVLGVALDSYATWWDPEIDAEIAQIGPRLVNLHIADWLPETRDLRLDRGMPGDGVIDLTGFVLSVREAGYEGPLEFEVFSSQNWWTRPLDEIAQTIVERYRALNAAVEAAAAAREDVLAAREATDAEDGPTPGDDDTA